MQIRRAVLLASLLAVSACQAQEYAGLTGPVGAGSDGKRVRTLRLSEPEVYENILVDGEWIDRDLVRILANDVVLRNCTVRYGQRDAVEVYGRNVR